MYVFVARSAVLYAVAIAVYVLPDIDDVACSYLTWAFMAAAFMDWQTVAQPVAQPMAPPLKKHLHLAAHHLRLPWE